MTFTEACRAGLAQPHEIDDWIDRWHDEASDQGPLHEYLGLTWVQYAAWVTQPSILADPTSSSPSS